MIAVFDSGKTHSRLALIGPAGETLRAWSTPTPTRRDGPYPAEDVDALRVFLLDALREAAREGPVRAVIPVAHGAAGALVNDHGAVLPVLDYEHDGPDGIETDYAAIRPPFAETLSPAMARGLNLGRQMFWQRARFPEAFDRATAVLCLPQYWAWVLSGVMATEATSIGAHTDLWDPVARAPSSLARRLGWDALLPPLRPAWAPLGPVRPEIAAATGLDPAASVLCGVHDSNASLLPHLGAGGPAALVSTGTWGIVMHVGGPVERLDEDADMLANVDALGRPTPSARFMAGREHAAIAQGDAPASEAAAAAVLAAGAMALPAFSDQGGPWRRRAGRIEGAAPDAPGARSALAALYCALVTDDLLDRLGVAGRVAVDGPFAGNALYMAALAALRAPQSVAALAGGGSAQGAALLADWGAPRPAPDPAPTPPSSLPLAAYRARWRAALG